MVEINKEAQGIPDKYLISSLTDSPVENSPNVVDPVAPAEQENVVLNFLYYFKSILDD